MAAKPTSRAPGAPPPGAADDRNGRWTKVSYQQLSIPIPPRGAILDGEHLTPLEFKLLAAIGIWSWNGEPCWPSYDMMAEAIGLRGKHRGRYVRYLFAGRVIQRRDRPAKHHPGLIERGWVRIAPGKDRVHHLIIPTEKWLKAQQLNVFRASEDESHLGARAPKSEGRARLSGEPRLRRARPPELDSDSERPREDSRSSSSVSLNPAGMPTATVRGPDDDDPSLRPWRGEATEAAAVFFDGDTTRARAWVDAIASDAEATLGERVGEYPAALRKAARVKNGGPKDSNRLHAYCLSILRKGTVSAGEPLTRPGAGGPTAVGPNRWEAVIREGPKHPDYPSAVAETRRILEHVRSSGYAFQIEPDGTTVKTVKTVPPFNEVLPPVVRDELRALKPILLTILAVEAGS